MDLSCVANLTGSLPIRWREMYCPQLQKSNASLLLCLLPQLMVSELGAIFMPRNDAALFDASAPELILAQK